MSVRISTCTGRVQGSRTCSPPQTRGHRLQAACRQTGMLGLTGQPALQVAEVLHPWPWQEGCWQDLSGALTRGISACSSLAGASTGGQVRCRALSGPLAPARRSMPAEHWGSLFQLAAAGHSLARLGGLHGRLKTGLASATACWVCSRPESSSQKVMQRAAAPGRAGSTARRPPGPPRLAALRAQLRFTDSAGSTTVLEQAGRLLLHPGPLPSSWVPRWVPSLARRAGEHRSGHGHLCRAADQRQPSPGSRRARSAGAEGAAPFLPASRPGRG